MKKIILIAGGSLLLYIVIVLAIAVIPAIELSRVPPGPGVVDLTPLQAAGRVVFAANGCDYCHTQQVRPLDEDKPFGRPSAPGDFAYQTPELLGSERTGPDLTNVGATKGSDVWQYIHLYDPRAVVPESIMPDFKFLFKVMDKAPAGETPVPIPAAFAPKHGVVIPTQKAKALVAYLLSLKQTSIPGYSMGGAAAMPASASTPAAGAAAPAAAGAAAAGGYVFDAAKGQQLFVATCAACHQASGEGVPGAFPPLKGNPAVLDADPTLHLKTILEGAHGKTIAGVAYGSAMPPFAGQLSDIQVADIANHERTSWGNEAKEVTPEEVAAVRAGKPLGAGTSTSAAPAVVPTAAASVAVATPAAAGGYRFDATKGRALFTSTCAACHQASGEGIPGAFPPLKGNAVVADADPMQHIHTILFGAEGLTVGGVKYAGAMPPFGSQLDDAAVADIANHERTSWGNKAALVTPTEVAAVRAKGK